MQYEVEVSTERERRLTIPPSLSMLNRSELFLSFVLVIFERLRPDQRRMTSDDYLRVTTLSYEHILQRTKIEVLKVIAQFLMVR